MCSICGTADGSEDVLLARAVIDASGTWSTPNPLGRGRCAGARRAGRGRLRSSTVSPMCAARSASATRASACSSRAAATRRSMRCWIWPRWRQTVPGTEITWVVRRGEMGQAYGGGANDALPARGALGQRIRALVEQGVVRLITGWRTDRVLQTADGIVVAAGDASARARRRDHRRHRAPARSRDAARAAARARPGGGSAHGPGTADRPEPPQLRHGAAAWRGRAGASGTRLLYRRHEKLRPRADVLAVDRLRAGALGGGRAGGRLGRSTRCPTGAAGNGRVLGSGGRRRRDELLRTNQCRG